MFFIGILKSTALYGIFSLLVGTLACRVDLATMYNATFNLTTFQNVFYAFMFWSPAAFIVFCILHFLVCKIKDGDSIGDWFSEALGRFVATFSNPWRGLVALGGATRTIDSFDWYGLYCWIQVIVHFVWSLALFGFIGYGFYCILR